eukprot:SAG31_NODE_1119_length_9813_cov_49.321289_4_plen_177_part_00
MMNDDMTIMVIPPPCQCDTQHIHSASARDRLRGRSSGLALGATVTGHRGGGKELLGCGNGAHLTVPPEPQESCCGSSSTSKARHTTPKHSIGTDLLQRTDPATDHAPVKHRAHSQAPALPIPSNPPPQPATPRRHCAANAVAPRAPDGNEHAHDAWPEEGLADRRIDDLVHCHAIF